MRSPWAWLPTVMGGATTALGAALVAGNAAPGKWLAFYGITGVVFGVASAVTRLMTKTTELTLEVMAEDRAARADAGTREAILHEAFRSAEAARDKEARRRLDRLETALDRMTRLALDGAGESQDPRLPADLGGRARQLWDKCLAGVRRSVELVDAARDLATADARHRVIAQRKSLLEEVDAAMHRLDKSLDHLRLAVVGSDATASDLADLSDELDRGLEVARRVDERLDALESTGRVRH